MNNIVGEWKIIEMEEWDLAYINLVEPGYFFFDDEEMGEFVFGTVNGSVDYRIDMVDGKERVEYSWEGSTESDSTCGRGWFEFEKNNVLCGRLFIHDGDDSMIRIKKK